MSFELKGAYRLVLDFIYMQGGNLPDDARYISGLLGCSVKKWNSMRVELLKSEKIIARNGFLTNLRAITELETLGRFQDKQAKNAATDRNIKELEKPKVSHTDTDTERKKETPIVPKGDVDEQEFIDLVWNEFPRHPQATRGAAWKAYRRLTPDERPKCIGGVARYSISFEEKYPDETEREMRRQYVPALSKWISQKGWQEQYEQ